MRLLFVLAIIGLAAVGCNKSSDAARKSYPDTLSGKWRYVEYFASSGPPGSWYPASPQGQWIELKENGIVNSNMDPFKDATGYELPASKQVKFIIPSKPQGYLLFQYQIDTIQAALIISPLNPICIEGCAIKFKR